MLGNEEFVDYAERNTTDLGDESSLGENFNVGVGLMIDEELSISKYIGSQGLRDRDDEIRKLSEDGLIDPSVIKMFSAKQPRRGNRTDYNAIANYLNENEILSQKIKTDDELSSERNAELESRRKYRDGVSERAGLGGKIAGFGGSLVGSSVDPFSAVAMVATGGATTGIQGLTRTMYTLSQTGKGFLAGVAEAALVEPFIDSWKEEIGADYTLEDSMFNMIASGVLNGSVNGLVGNLSFRSKAKVEAKTNKELQDRLEAEAEEFAEIEAQNKEYPKMSWEERETTAMGLRNQGIDAAEADNMAQFMYETSNFPNQKMDAEEVVWEMERTKERMEQGSTKQDKEPTFGADDDELVEVAFAGIKNKDIREIFDESIVQDDVNYKNLEQKMVCLNG